MESAIWIASLRISPQDHVAEVEFALAPLRTNIVLAIDIRQSEKKVSQIVSQAFGQLQSTLKCELWKNVGIAAETLS